ncbi:hypothetical protein MTO96_001607 [Rhipicephalus appendiculatus]
MLRRGRVEAGVRPAKRAAASKGSKAGATHVGHTGRGSAPHRPPPERELARLAPEPCGENTLPGARGRPAEPVRFIFMAGTVDCLPLEPTRVCLSADHRLFFF